MPTCHLALTIALTLKYKLQKEMGVGQILGAGKSPGDDDGTLDADTDYTAHETDTASQYPSLPLAKLDILVADGKHDTKEEIDKQVNDKERVEAALENGFIRDAIKDLTRERNWY